MVDFSMLFTFERELLHLNENKFKCRAIFARARLDSLEQKYHKNQFQNKNQRIFQRYFQNISIIQLLNKSK